MTKNGCGRKSGWVLGCGRRNLRPTLNELPSYSLYLKNTFQVYTVKAPYSKIDFSIFCLYGRFQAKSGQMPFYENP